MCIYLLAEVDLSSFLSIIRDLAAAISSREIFWVQDKMYKRSRTLILMFWLLLGYILSPTIAVSVTERLWMRGSQFSPPFPF